MLTLLAREIDQGFHYCIRCSIANEDQKVIHMVRWARHAGRIAESMAESRADSMA
jgi:hypothetical protein